MILSYLWHLGKNSNQINEFPLKQKVAYDRMTKTCTFSLRILESMCYFLSVARRGVSCESLWPVGETIVIARASEKPGI